MHIQITLILVKDRSSTYEKYAICSKMNLTPSKDYYISSVCQIVLEFKQPDGNSLQAAGPHNAHAGRLP